jgi:hypothetical protein
MRLDLREGNQVEGLRAVMLLRQTLFPSSWDNVQDLFARYPSAAIEFSAYEFPVGHLRGRNTVIWRSAITEPTRRSAHRYSRLQRVLA